MSAATAKSAQDAMAEWRAHWPVVVAACAGVAISTINIYSLGVFMQPLEQEFGWSRASIASGTTIAGVATILFAPVMGAVIDRFGPRRIGIAGVAIMCVFTAMLSLTGPSITSWQGVWVLLALINVAILPNIWTAAVTSHFSAGRGLALAVTLCGSGIGSMLTPLLAVRLVESLGWRNAYLALPAIWAVVVLPLLLLFFRSKREHGDDLPIARERVSRNSPMTAARSILWSSSFIRLAIATVLIATVIVPLGITLVPILSSRGLTRENAAEIAALMGVASIIGRLTIGYLLDRINARRLAAIAVCIPILACLLLILWPGSTAAATFAVVCIGLALGAELDIVAYLASRFFSLSRFAFVFGTLAGIVTLGGSGLGPLAINAIYDHFQSYVPALWIAIPMCLASSLLFFTLGTYPEELERSS